MEELKHEVSCELETFKVQLLEEIRGRHLEEKDTREIQGEPLEQRRPPGTKWTGVLGKVSGSRLMVLLHVLNICSCRS